MNSCCPKAPLICFCALELFSFCVVLCCAAVFELLYAALGVTAGCIVASVSRGAKPWQLKSWYEQLYVDIAALAAAAWVASCN